MSIPNLTYTPALAPTPVLRPKEPQHPSNEEYQEQQYSQASIPQPKWRLHAQELRHQGTSEFLLLIPDLASLLDRALQEIIKILYTQPKRLTPTTPTSKSPFFIPSIPPTRSVTIFLRGYDGVAYTTSTELDHDHKEIHLSLDYIHQCVSKERAAKADPLAELRGVLTHELVHCFQHATPNKDDRKIPGPPGGLIEGIADFVRLKAGLQPPHWIFPKSSSQRAKKWDAGYQHTAFFLAWIEDVWIGSPGTIGMLNDRLLKVGYIGEDHDVDKGSAALHFWRGLFGVTVAELWEEYGRWLDHDGVPNIQDYEKLEAAGASGQYASY